MKNEIIKIANEIILKMITYGRKICNYRYSEYGFYEK
jgi:hypothetical protein